MEVPGIRLEAVKDAAQLDDIPVRGGQAAEDFRTAESEDGFMAVEREERKISFAISWASVEAAPSICWASALPPSAAMSRAMATSSPALI